MLQSCRYAISNDNPDSYVLKTFLKYSSIIVQVLGVYYVCFFPGLIFLSEDPSQSLCPSLTNKSFNELLCLDNDKYWSYDMCVFAHVNYCSIGGCLISLSTLFSIYVIAWLFIQYRRRKSFASWRGSLLKTFIFLIMYSDENPHGIFFYPNEDDVVDEDRFHPRKCCGYVATRVFWSLFYLTLFGLFVTVIMIIYYLLVAAPLGYLISLKTSFFSEKCYDFTSNTTLQECRYNETCYKDCQIVGSILLIFSIILLIVLMAILNFIYSCLKAFKLPAEITMEMGELNPLLPHQ